MGEGRTTSVVMNDRPAARGVSLRALLLVIPAKARRKPGSTPQHRGGGKMDPGFRQDDKRLALTE